jgi:hypothetical protein
MLWTNLDMKNERCINGYEISDTSQWIQGLEIFKFRYVFREIHYLFIHFLMQVNNFKYSDPSIYP